MCIQNNPRPGAATRLAGRTAKARGGTAATIGRCLIRTLLCVAAVPSISDDPAQTHYDSSRHEAPSRPTSALEAAGPHDPAL